MSALDKVKDMAAKANLKSRPQQREAAAAKADKNAKAASQFEQDFNLIDEYFGLDRRGEREQALETARLDPVNARICYASIANSLRYSDVSTGITARIKTRIAADAKVVA